MEKEITFNHLRNAEAASYIKKRGDAYIALNGGRFANTQAHIKSIIIVILFVYVYKSGLVSAVWPAIIFSFLRGIMMGGIGFNIMHAAAHRSYSPYSLINKTLAFTADLVGWSMFQWNIVHNQEHHSYPNIDGHDNDVNNEPFLRQSPSQKRRWFHKYQHWYMYALYAISSLVILVNDIRRYFKGNTGMTQREHFVWLIGKALYCLLYLFIPFYLLEWKIALLGFLCMHVGLGLTLNFVFPLAHLSEDVAYPVPDESGVIDNNNRIHQIETTANFGADSIILELALGGLHLQQSHHFWPHVHERHYRGLNKIIQEGCTLYGIKSKSYKYWGGAFLSHYRHMRNMGRSDANLAIAA